LNQCEAQRGSSFQVRQGWHVHETGLFFYIKHMSCPCMCHSLVEWKLANCFLFQVLIIAWILTGGMVIIVSLVVMFVWTSTVEGSHFLYASSEHWRVVIISLSIARSKRVCIYAGCLRQETRMITPFIWRVMKRWPCSKTFKNNYNI